MNLTGEFGALLDRAGNERGFGARENRSKPSRTEKDETILWSGGGAGFKAGGLAWEPGERPFEKQEVGAAFDEARTEKRGERCGTNEDVLGQLRLSTGGRGWRGESGLVIEESRKRGGVKRVSPNICREGKAESKHDGKVGKADLNETRSFGRRAGKHRAKYSQTFQLPLSRVRSFDPKRNHRSLNRCSEYESADASEEDVDSSRVFSAPERAGRTALGEFEWIGRKTLRGIVEMRSFAKISEFGRRRSGAGFGLGRLGDTGTNRYTSFSSLSSN
ncbi:hypothetical protein R3P38DRAFT_3620369 [Favolaschia claudopus]|uniref:Uncharacterized protein n=1 Tax=Favolaschia claudopus TaxID=2862362 RepID=A0AAW0DC80_9AGAR